MKRTITLLVLCCICFANFAQNVEIKNSPEVNVGKGAVYMEVLMKDGTDVIALKTENLVKKLNASYILCRFDENMAKVYETNLDKHIGDRFMYYAGSLQGRIYVFTSEIKKGKFYLYGIELDKATGKNVGEEKTICTYELMDKFDQFIYMIKPDSDGANWIITAKSDNKNDGVFNCAVVGPDLVNKYTIRADSKVKPKQVYQLEQVIPEKDGNIILAGKLFDIVEVKKQYSWVLNRYFIQRYDKSGKRVTDNALDLKDKTLLACKLVKAPASEKIVVAGTYSNTATNAQTDGLFFAPLDNSTLTTGTFSLKEISAADKASLSADAAYPGQHNFIFYDFAFNKKTNQLIFSAETYAFSVKAVPFWYSDRMNDPISFKPVYEQDAKRFVDKESVRPIDTYTYNCGDILLLTADLTSNTITSYTVLPKRQTEKIAQNPDNNYPGIDNAISIASPARYMDAKPVGPFYSSYSLSLVGEKVLVLYNEQLKDPEMDKKKDGYTGFYSSKLNAFVVNPQNGSYTRKEVSENGNRPVFMPRFNFTAGRDVYLTAMKITNKVEGSCRLVKLTIGE